MVSNELTVYETVEAIYGVLSGLRRNKPISTLAGYVVASHISPSSGAERLAVLGEMDGHAASQSLSHKPDEAKFQLTTNGGGHSERTIIEPDTPPEVFEVLDTSMLMAAVQKIAEHNRPR